MAEILIITRDTTYARRLEEAVFSRSWNLNVIHHEPSASGNSVAEAGWDAVVFDLREGEITTDFRPEAITAVLCSASEIALAEKWMTERNAYVVIQERESGTPWPILFTLRKALHEDDRHGTALEAARNTASRYEDLLRAVPDIVYRLDVDGNFTFINEAISALGYTPEELLGRHFTVLIHEEDIDRVSRRSVLPRYTGKETGETGSPGLFDERRGRDRRTKGLEVRLRGRSLNGEESSSAGLVVSYGEVSATGHYRQVRREKVFTGTVGIIRDITWRKRSERMLQLTSMALEQSATGVCIATPAGRIEYANPRYSRMLGVPHDSLLETPMERLWDSHYLEGSFQETLERTEREGSTAMDVECCAFVDTPLWIVLRTELIHDSYGNRYILILQDDIGERKDQEERLIRAAEEKGILLQEVHHRVKNNLQVIASMLSIEAEDQESPAVKEFLAASKRRIRAMALVHDALYHSDTQARLDLPTYLQQVLDGVTQGQDSEVEVKRTLPPSFEVDLSVAIPFGLVVNELVGNALRNVEESEGKELEVTLNCDEEMVLTVSGGQQPETPDQGASLLIVQALAHQLEGSLDFDSENGVVFRVKATAPVELGEPDSPTP